ncbi:MAG: hypothetical protein ACOC1O_01485 [bacterium]
MGKYNSKFSVEWQMERWGLSREEAERKVENMKYNCGKSKPYSVEWQMERWGLSREEAERKVENMKNKIRNSQKNMSEFDYKAMSSKNKEHWIKKGYSEEEAIRIAKKQLKYMQNEAYRKLKESPEKYKGCFNTQLEYWLKKTDGDLEKAEELLRERQATNTIKYYIEKYGDKGYDYWRERNKNWSLKVEKMYKNGEFKNPRFDPDNTNAISKIEKEFLDNLVKHLYNNGIKSKKQLRLKKEDGTYYMYDFVVENKIVIEFNGDFWHANPKFYNENYIHPVLNESAKEIWKKEEKKLNLLEKNGYEYIIVWEHEYKENKEELINKTLNLIYEKLRSKTA